MKQKKILYLISIVFFFAIFTGIYFLYNYFTSPRFTLHLIHYAIQERNKKQFLQYVDLDSILSNFLQQIKDHIQHEANPEDPIDKFKVQLKIQLINKIQPLVIPALKKQILSYFDNSQPDSKLQHSKEIEKLLLLSQLKMLIDPVSFVIEYYIHSTDCTNQICIINIAIQPKNAPLIILKLQFIKENHYWKLSSLPNLFEVLLKFHELKDIKNHHNN